MHSSDAGMFCEDQEYEPRILKSVILERTDTEIFEEIVISLHYNVISREVDFARSFNEHLHKEYAQIHRCYVHYFNVATNRYQLAGVFPFMKECSVKYEDIQGEKLHVRLTVCDDLWVEGKGSEKLKAKERTVHEVLLKVAEWRGAWQKSKVTLEMAAKSVGLSKKTLDDYYLQIRLAQAYGFHFQAHQHHGIGVLRKFVKSHHVKKQTPTLKILDKFKHQLPDHSHPHPHLKAEFLDGDRDQDNEEDSEE